MKKLLYCSVIPALLSAQTASPDQPLPPLPPPGNVFFYQSAMPPVQIRDGKPVKNAPYQAQVETQTVQHLADGNTIQNSHASKVARDSQGRTWTEEAIEKIGPWSAQAGPHTIVFISDPVAGTSYVLHPETKTAEKMVAKPLPGGPGPKGNGKTVLFQRRVTGPGSGGEAGVTDIITETAAPGKIEKFGPAELGDEQTEDLGTQQINGVLAQGKRVTRTVPANTIGNQLPIASVTETWYSPDLQIVVQSKHNDPRFGETTLNIKNIQKGDPSPDLFQVPSDYTVTEGPRVSVHLKP
jgi:hypothetical protein